MQGVKSCLLGFSHLAATSHCAPMTPRLSSGQEMGITNLRASHFNSGILCFVTFLIGRGQDRQALLSFPVHRSHVTVLRV